MKNLWRAIPIRPTLCWTNLSLILLGGVSLLLYEHGLGARRTSEIIWFIKLALAQATLYLAAAWMVWRAQASRLTFIIVIIFATLFRFSILSSVPALSDDIYRYIWDGRVQAAGINPYRYIPADAALASLRDEAIYPNINRRDYAPTIYPPVAQLLFLLVTRISESVTCMKAAMVGFEAVAMWALIVLLRSFGWPRQRILIAAWHPLLVWEIAGNGHLDAVVIAFIAIALLARSRGMDAATGVALACATLVKFFPVVLFPALYRRWGWRMPVAFTVISVLAYLPYLNVGASRVVGFLPSYTSEEGLQSGERFFILSLVRRLLAGATVPNAAFLVFAFLILSAVALWFLWKREQSATNYVIRAFILASVFMILLSPRHSWYFTWLVPFLCFAPVAPVFYLTTASFVLYGMWLSSEPSHLFALNAFLYVPFALLCAMTLSIPRKRAEAQP